MLELVNRTPFAAERSVLLDKDGNQIWVVVIKATYLIGRKDDLELHPEPEPVCLAPKYFSEAAKSSLLREGEMVYDHPGTDITLNATAYAPSGKKARAVRVSFSVGHIKKTLIVYGDRYWRKGITGLKMTKPDYFSSLPIRYERAYGGAALDQKTGAQVPYPQNSIGAGFALRAKDLVDKPAPTVLYPDKSIHGWKSRAAPAGFGAVYASWSPRKEYAGTYDQAWQNERMPLWPEDFDPRYHQSAPVDQVSPKSLRGGERVVLEHMTREPTIAFRLPRVFLTVETQLNDTRIRQPIQLDRVIIEPDQNKLAMVWRSSFNCRANARVVEKSIIETKPVIGRT
jgi:hypothetical protein